MPVSYGRDSVTRFRESLREAMGHYDPKDHVPRSKVIDETTAIEGIRYHCQKAMKAYKNGRAMYRGTPSGDGQTFLYVKPSKGNRVSANTLNIYTMVIDNHSEWKKYPKRSKSIIGSTSLSGAYGRTFVVFAKDGSNYGITPENDFWNSFEKSARGVWLDSMMDDIDQLAFEFGVDRKPFSKKDYGKLKEKLEEIDIHIHNSEKDMKNWRSWTKYYDGDMLKLLQKVLVPGKNGFKLTKDPMDIKSDSSSGSEVWTDGDAYMVYWKWLQNTDNLEKLYYGDT